MKTIVIRIGALDATAKGYPITLLAEEGAPPKLVEKAAAVIARSLAPAAAVPDDGADREPLNAKRVMERYAELAGSSSSVTAMGTFLFNLINVEPLATAWKALRTAYPGENPQQGTESLRTYLDIETDAPRALPWELIGDPDHPTPFFHDAANPWLRGIPGAAGTTEGDWPIRLLVVVGTPTVQAAGAAGIASARELDQLDQAFSLLRYDMAVDLCEQPASRTELMEMFDEVRPHIVHFIGHALVGTTAASTALQFKTLNGPGWEWKVPQIGASLKGGGRAPRFAFLNACRTNDVAERKRIASIAQAFLSAGTLGVIATQGDIPGDVAAIFAGKFYRELSHGSALDVATAAARVAISDEKGIDTRDWSLPVLTVAARVEQILPQPPADVLREITQFVDRRVEQRHLHKSIDPIGPVPNESHVLLVRGASEVGKSWFVQWCLQTCASRSRNVRYVDLAEEIRVPGLKDYLEVLRHIRTGEKDKRLRRGLSADATHRFNAELNALLKGNSIPPPVEPPPAVDDDGSPLPSGDDPRIAEDMAKQIISAFQSALKREAGGKPLVLAIDHISAGVVPEMFRKFIVEYLIKSIALGQLQPIRVILVLTDGEDDLQQLGLSDLPGPPRDVQLQRFRQAEFERLVLDYCRQVNLPPDRAKWYATRYARDMIAGPWEPRWLSFIRDTIRNEPR